MTIEVLNVRKNYEGKPYLKSASLNIVIDLLSCRQTALIGCL